MLELVAFMHTEVQLKIVPTDGVISPRFSAWPSRAIACDTRT